MKWLLSIPVIVVVLGLSVLVSSQSNLTVAAGPDLVINNIQAWQVTATDLRVIFTVENIGNEDAVSSVNPNPTSPVPVIQLTYGGFPYVITDILSIKWNNKQDFEIVVPYDPTATTIDAAVDPDDNVPTELDENNNNYVYTVPATSPTLVPLPPGGQPSPPSNLQRGWTIDQNGDAWLAINIEQGLNLVSSIFTSAGAQHPSSTIEPTTDFKVVWLLDPVVQTFVECYPGVSTRNQPQECVDFSNRISTDPNYQKYILSLGGFAESTKSGQLIYYFPASSIQQLKDPIFLQGIFSQLNFADGYNILFTGPWFEGLTLDQVKGSCTYGNIYGWDAVAQDWVGPLAQMTTLQAQSTDIGTSGLVEANGDCTMAYQGGARPTLPPRSGVGPTITALPSLLTTPTPQPGQAPDLVIGDIGVSLSSTNDLSISFDILNNGNLDTEVPDINIGYVGIPASIDGSQANIVGGSGSSPTTGPRTISPGAAKTIEYTTVYDPNQALIEISLDPSDNVVEIDENNNADQYIIGSKSGDPCDDHADCINSNWCSYTITGSQRTCS